LRDNPVVVASSWYTNDLVRALLALFSAIDFLAKNSVRTETETR
jgi:hypothetical protein